MVPGPSRGCKRPLLRTAALAALLTAAVHTGGKSLGFAVPGVQWRSTGSMGPGARQLTIQSRMAAGVATDNFDPWTVLGICTGDGVPEARKAYKKLIARYHPDVDPSPEAEVKFRQVVRAHAIITGEDRDLEQSVLLRNAVENMRNDIEFRRSRIESMKIKAEQEEAKVAQMEQRLVQAEVKRDKVTQELGVYGGGTLGLIVAGPTGAILGAAVGLVLKDRDDSIGQVIRGVGSLTKGVVDAVGKAVGKKD